MYVISQISYAKIDVCGLVIALCKQCPYEFLGFKKQKISHRNKL